MKAAGHVLQAVTGLFLEFALVSFSDAFVIVLPASHHLRLDHIDRIEGLLGRRIRPPLRGCHGRCRRVNEAVIVQRHPVHHGRRGDDLPSGASPL